MEAKLMKKSGGMNHIKKTGGMQHAKKTGGMNVTKKVGGKCGMTVHSKGGMYKKTKGGTLKKLLKGGDDGVLAMNGVKYQVKMDGDSVTVTKLVDDEIPPAEPAAEEEKEVTEPAAEEDLGVDEQGPLKIEDLENNEENAEGEEEVFSDVEDQGSPELKKLLEGIDGDLEKEEIAEEYNKLTPEEQDEVIQFINESDRTDKASILEEIDPKEGLAGLGVEGGKHHKKKGGKTLKKGGKHHKKHAGSVKKAFNKLFKRGGNKVLPKKGGKK